MEKKKSTVLIVDDVLKNIQLLGNMLQKKGYEISFATSGQQALGIVKIKKPNLILLDIMMPGIDGYEVCTELKKDDELKDIPIIFLTAKTESEDIIKGFNVGAVDYISKPFIQEELLARVKVHFELMENRKLISEMKEREMFNATVVTANHEIRQPLAVIQGSIDLISIHKEDDLKNGYEMSPNSSKFFDRMKKSVSKISKILDNLRNIEKPEYITYHNETKMIDISKE